MRSTLSALMVLLGLIVAAVAGPAMWLQHNVVDQKGFTEMVGPLGSNKDFQSGLASLLSDQATSSLDLPPQLNALAEAVIVRAAQSIYTEPGYEAAWTQTLQRSHGLTFEAAGNKDVAGDVVLDLAPLVDLVVKKVAGDLPFDVPTPEDVLIKVEQPEVAKALAAATTLGGWGVSLAIIAVVLFALAIIMARRRSRTLVLVGVGLGAVALLWLLTSSYVQSRLADLVVGPEAAQNVGTQLAELARASWQGGITATFIAAGVIVVLGVGTLMVRPSRTT